MASPSDHREAGYQAFIDGEPFDKFQYGAWQDGWLVARDFTNWKTLADAVGAECVGFSGDYVATFRWGTQTYEIGGGLLDALKRFTARPDAPTPDQGTPNHD